MDWSKVVNWFEEIKVKLEEKENLRVTLRRVKAKTRREETKWSISEKIGVDKEEIITWKKEGRAWIFQKIMLKKK